MKKLHMIFFRFIESFRKLNSLQNFVELRLLEDPIWKAGHWTKRKNNTTIKETNEHNTDIDKMTSLSKKNNLDLFKIFDFGQVNLFVGRKR